MLSVSSWLIRCLAGSYVLFSHATSVEPVTLHSEKSVCENSRHNFTDTKLMMISCYPIEIYFSYFIANLFIQWNNLSTAITKSITIYLCIMATSLSSCTSLATNA